MILEVLEGQTKGGYFSDSIFDPSVNQCNGHVSPDSAQLQVMFLLDLRPAFSIMHSSIKKSNLMRCLGKSS